MTCRRMCLFVVARKRAVQLRLSFPRGQRPDTSLTTIEDFKPLQDICSSHFASVMNIQELPDDLNLMIASYFWRVDLSHYRLTSKDFAHIGAEEYFKTLNFSFRRIERSLERIKAIASSPYVKHIDSLDYEGDSAYIWHSKERYNPPWLFQVAREFCKAGSPMKHVRLGGTRLDSFMSTEHLDKLVVLVVFVTAPDLVALLDNNAKSSGEVSLRYLQLGDPEINGKYAQPDLIIDNTREEVWPKLNEHVEKMSLKYAYIVEDRGPPPRRSMDDNSPPRLFVDGHNRELAAIHENPQ